MATTRTTKTTTKATLAAPASMVTGMSNKVVVLDREQLSQTRLPGAQFARDLASPGLQPVSLTSMMAMGLVGGAVGFGVSRLRKGSGLAGAISGGLLGAGGAFAYGKLRKGEELEVVSALADETGKGTILLLTNKQTATALRTKQALSMSDVRYPSPLFLSKLTTLVPPGWAGAIMQHGVLVQAAQMKYVWRHAQFMEPTQVAPHKGYETNTWKAGGMTATASSVLMPGDEDYSNSTLFTERFAEWPTPAWPGYGLGITAVEAGTLQSRIVKVLADNRGTRRTKHQGLDEAFQKYGLALPSYYGNRSPSISSYWSTAARMVTFNDRYSLMVRNAQWFVWAGEMFRLHSTDAWVSPPDWWADHCAQWGVGCASAYKVINNKRMTTYNAQEWCEDTKNKVVDNPLLVPFSRTIIEEYLKLVVQHTPAPFTSSSLQQMTVGHQSRMLLDMPLDYMASMAPPLAAINLDYFRAIVAKRAATGAPKGMRVFVYIVGAVVEIVATYFGGPAGMVFSAVWSAMISLVMLAMNNPSAFSKMSAGDICKLVAQLVSQVVEALDIEIDDFLGEISGGTMDMLKNLQKAADKAGVADMLEGITTAYTALESAFNWPYVDEFLATMQDSGATVGLSADVIEHEMDKA